VVENAVSVNTSQDGVLYQYAAAATEGLLWLERPSVEGFGLRAVGFAVSVELVKGQGSPRCAAASGVDNIKGGELPNGIQAQDWQVPRHPNQGPPGRSFLALHVLLSQGREVR